MWFLHRIHRQLSRVPLYLSLSVSLALWRVKEHLLFSNNSTKEKRRNILLIIASPSLLCTKCDACANVSRATSACLHLDLREFRRRMNDVRVSRMTRLIIQYLCLYAIISNLIAYVRTRTQSNRLLRRNGMIFYASALKYAWIRIMYLTGSSSTVHVDMYKKCKFIAATSWHSRFAPCRLRNAGNGECRGIMTRRNRTLRYFRRSATCVSRLVVRRRR